MVVRMRHTRAHSGNRRSHHAVTEPRFSVCNNCGTAHVRHRMCGRCGTYRGLVIIDVKAKLDRKLKRKKEKEKAGAR